MKTKSAKAKGRRLAQTVQVNLLEACPDLSQDDVRVTPSGVQGPDIQLSPAAQKRFPYAIECKNVESLCFSSAWRQAVSHSNQTGLLPLLVACSNRAKPLCVIRSGNAVEWLCVPENRSLTDSYGKRCPFRAIPRGRVALFSRIGEWFAAFPIDVFIREFVR
jgi:hypothetical protein